ncbi:WGxxGxxG family protein [Deinococcus yunweiensis]|uniref:WGxxGxxG family protein n=1 Tax=Deinococcus yunweiensis TaxID=367282 RepID=UPI00398F0122
MTTTTRAALLTLTILLAPLPALAQDTDTTAPTGTSDTVTPVDPNVTDAGTVATTDATEERDTDWGWLGLLGLAGLAGLRRPAPTRVITPDPARPTTPRP